MYLFCLYAYKIEYTCVRPIPTIQTLIASFSDSQETNLESQHNVNKSYCYFFLTHLNICDLGTVASAQTQVLSGKVALSMHLQTKFPCSPFPEVKHTGIHLLPLEREKKKRISVSIKAACSSIRTAGTHRSFFFPLGNPCASLCPPLASWQMDFSVGLKIQQRVERAPQAGKPPASKKQLENRVTNLLEELV